MKIKINDNIRSKSTEVGDATLSQFTNAEINSIFPASDLLHKINFDHVYSTNGNSSLRLKYRPKESKSLPDRTPARSRQDPENSTLDRSRSETWADESYDEDISDDSLTDDPTLSLNADSIQQVFQRMIDLTSLDAIDTKLSDLKAGNDKNKSTPTKKVVFVDELPETAKASPVTSAQPSASRNKLGEIAVPKQDSKTPTKKSKKSTKQKTNACDSPSKCTKVPKNGKLKAPNKTLQNDLDSKYKLDDDERNRRLAKKYAEAEREMNVLLNYTRELLVKRWGEYLCMTTEKIRSFEIENARQQKMMEDVVEMLEDKDLYVWQLIDDLRFF